MTPTSCRPTACAECGQITTVEPCGGTDEDRQRWQPCVFCRARAIAATIDVDEGPTDV